MNYRSSELIAAEMLAFDTVYAQAERIPVVGHLYPNHQYLF